MKKRNMILTEKSSSSIKGGIEPLYKKYFPLPPPRQKKHPKTPFSTYSKAK